MSEPKNENTVSESLDDVIITLQKTFSRISEKSANVPEEQARALVTGIVNFEISTTVNPEGDRLIVTKSGEVQITLKGQIETDIREISEL
ncbi:MAG: hypothetical protein V3U78_01810 [Thiotrichaceae bacterium]